MELCRVWDTWSDPDLSAAAGMPIFKGGEVHGVVSVINKLFPHFVPCEIMWNQKSSHGQPRKGNHGTFTQKDEDVLSAICHSPSHGKGDETGSDDLAL